MTTRLLAVCALTAALTAAPASEARADWLLTPYLGVTFEGSAPEQKLNYGVSSMFLGAGVLGFEIDAAISPNFFDLDDGLIDDSNVSTVMGNLVVAAPGSVAFRPYLAAGAGVIRLKATSVGNFFDLDDNSLGINLGGGIVSQLSDRVGVRGDLRYFRSMRDADDSGGINLDLTGFNFWRGTVGVTFRF